MDAQKAMLIVLVALVMLFVVTLGLAGSHGGGASDDPDPVAFLKGLQTQRFFELGDATSTTCGGPGEQLIVPAGGACQVTFDKRGRFGRPTRLAFRPSSSVRVRLVPERGPEQETTVDPDECFQSAVDAAGGIMTLGALTQNAVAVAFTKDPGSDCPKAEG